MSIFFFAKEQTEAIRRFREHMKMEIHETCLDDEIKPWKTDGGVKAESGAIVEWEVCYDTATYGEAEA